MAAVHAPRHPHPHPHQHQHSISSSSTGSNHSPFWRVHRATYVPPPAGKSYSASAAHAPLSPFTVHRFDGYDDTSKLCARFVCHTFNCPELHPLARVVFVLGLFEYRLPSRSVLHLLSLLLSNSPRSSQTLTFSTNKMSTEYNTHNTDQHDASYTQQWPL